MKGILLKDYYTLKRQIPLFLFAAVMLSTPKGNFAVYSMVYAALLPITAIAYDERSKWDTLAAAMPYTVSELVLSKYIVGWISTAVSGLVLIVVRRLMFEASYGKIGNGKDVLSLALPGIIIGLLIMSVIMPIIIKFGVEKGRLIYSLILGFFVGIIAVAGRIITNIPTGIDYTYAAAACGAVVILLSAASVGVSVLFYKQRNRT